MTLDQEWELAKPKILELMKQGWSKHVAMGKVGVNHGTKMFRLCYRPDRAFREKINSMQLPRITLFTHIDRPDILKEYREQVNTQVYENPHQKSGKANTR